MNTHYPKKGAPVFDQEGSKKRRDISGHGLKVEVQAVLTDQDNNVVRRYPWKRANSLLKQFIQLLTVQLSQTNQTIKKTNGVDQAGGVYASNFACNADADLTLIGIVIGTGITPVTMTDYKLQTQVTTNIAHAAVSFAVENPDTSTWRIAITRGFTNNTGATLSVKEVGLYVFFTASSYVVCADRTLYAVDVPSGVTLTLTYRITVSL